MPLPKIHKVASKTQMLEEVSRIGKLIGNTPMVHLKNEHCNMYAKLEYQNYSGSIKDRAVNGILYQAILHDEIRPGTTVIESSSGNFALSAALHCRCLGLKFIAVVDPNINAINLAILMKVATQVIKVTERDESGGYLLNRIKKVKQLLDKTPNSYWTNQYENENNYKSYFGLAEEIKTNFAHLDYLFVAVSSCGTYRGLKEYLEGHFHNLRIIAIDIEGSQIFSNSKLSRQISGLGASKRSSFIDTVISIPNIILTHREIIVGCNELLEEHALFVGGSSGACYAGAKRIFDRNKSIDTKANVLLIFPDRGYSYLDTIFDHRWVARLLQKKDIEVVNQII